MIHDYLKSAPDILRYGTIGLSFLLALLAYFLLYREQSHKDRNPDPMMLRSVRIFMIFAFCLGVLGFASETIKYFSGIDSDRVLELTEENNVQKGRLLFVEKKYRELIGFSSEAIADANQFIQCMDVPYTVFKEIVYGIREKPSSLPNGTCSRTVYEPPKNEID